MGKLYAVGDIHGMHGLLLQAIKMFQDDDTVVFMGDYIDRGKNNVKTIDTLVDFAEYRQGKTIFLRGNHEDMLLKALAGEIHAMDTWLWNGGSVTFNEFKMDYHKPVLPDKYQSFFDATKYYYKSDNFVFVHGGISTEQDIESQLTNNDAILWDRDAIEILKGVKKAGSDISKVFFWGTGQTVIVGHSILRQPLIGGDFIVIDTGSFLAPKNGSLTVLDCATRQYTSFR